MKKQTKHQVPAHTTSSQEVRRAVQRYKTKRLNHEQATSLLPAMRACVISAEPVNSVVAGQWMSILAGFLAATAPSNGGDLRTLLTSNRVNAWLSACAKSGTGTNVLKTRRGVLNRLVRAERGFASTITRDHRPQISAEPLDEATLGELLRACVADGRAAVRGFAAAFSTGRSGACLTGARRGTCLSQPVLELASGQQVPAVPSCIELLDEGDQIRDGDWHEVKAVASDLGVLLTPAVVAQTYRVAALSINAPLCDLVHRFSFDEPSLTELSRRIHTRALDDDEALQTMFQMGMGQTRPLLKQSTTRRRVHESTATDKFPTPSSRSSAGGGGAKAVKRSSRAAMQRLARELREAEEAPPALEADVADYVEGYIMVGTDPDAWGPVGEALRVMMRRTGVRTLPTARAYCTALGHYLSWRQSEGLSLEIERAMDHDAIDRFFVATIGEFGDRTRNNYRSRLRKIAQTLRPTAVAPANLGTGYNEVRQGYTAAEEAAFRQVALGQRRRIIRRRLCAVVGFGGGGGLDPVDVRELRASMVTIGDGPILVAVPGPKARTVVIRREYEPLVVAALEGLRPGDLVIGRNPKKANPVAGIISDADLFDDLPSLDMRRLRTTWITWVVAQPIPLGAVMAASGLTSARTLVDMIQYLPPVDFTVLRDGSGS